MLDLINDIKVIKTFSNEQLEILASEIREEIIKCVSKTGGHLASNLGIVDLIVCLFKNFDFNYDKIIFDVGHQCYAYKILTGRRKELMHLRQFGGISGFPKVKESKYDFFNTGHASNSISAALGIARARDLMNKDYNVVSLIGDGSLTGGMAFEALNDLGYRKTKMLIILNDNGMAISSNVGSLSNCLNKIRINPFYNRLRKRAHYKLDRINSTRMTGLIRRVKNGLKGLLLPSMFFENLGIRYIGPIDGHDIKRLNKTLNKVKTLDEPVVLHIKTIKGKGYKFAEENPNLYHGVDMFPIDSGIACKGINKRTYSSTFGMKICELAKHNNKIVAITAAMTEGTGLGKFSKEFKERFFDVGICEEHAVTLAAGFAIEGYKPFFAVYSTFLQRGFDQIIEDVCLQNLPVIFMVDRSGLVGSDGETHHGIFDNSFLSLIPNLTIMQPKCLDDLEIMLEFAVNFNSPLVIKYPKGSNKYPFKPIKKINYGKWEIVSKGSLIALVATGRMVEIAMLDKEKIKMNIMVINALFIKPIDSKLIKKLVKENYTIIVLEENVITGGLGSLVLVEAKQNTHIVGINDKFVQHGSVDILLEKENLCVNKICKMIKKIKE